MTGRMFNVASLCTALPFASLNRASLTTTMHAIGQDDGASTLRACVA